MRVLGVSGSDNISVGDQKGSKSYKIVDFYPLASLAIGDLDSPSAASAQLHSSESETKTG